MIHLFRQSFNPQNPVNPKPDNYLPLPFPAYHQHRRDITIFKRFKFESFVSHGLKNRRVQDPNARVTL